MMGMVALVGMLLPALACNWVDTTDGEKGDGAEASGIGPPGTIIWGQGAQREEDDQVWFLDPRIGAVGDWWLVPGYSMSVPATGNLLLIARVNWNDNSPVYAVTAFTLKPGGLFQEFWGFEDVNFTRVSFSPDGHRFATRDAVNSKWHALDVFSNFHMILENNVKSGTPVWAPDGNSLVVGGLYLWRLDVEEDLQRCVLGEDIEGDYERAFSFSPGGEWLAWGVATGPAGGEARRFLGYRFLHVESCTVVNPALEDKGHPGFLVNEEGGVPMAKAEPDPVPPVWAPDGRHLLLGERIPVLSDDGKCLATEPAPLQLLAVAETALAGKEAVTELAWSTKLGGGQCLSWRILGFALDGKAAILGVHRFEGGSPATWLGREILSIPLDGSKPTSLAVTESGLQPDDGEFGPHGISWQTGHLVLEGPPGRFARLEPATGDIGFIDAEAVSPDGSAYLTADWKVRDIYGNELLSLPAKPQDLIDHEKGEKSPYSVDSWR